MSKLALGIVAAATAAGAALVATTPGAPPPAAAPSTQAVGIGREPIERTPIERPPRPTDPLPPIVRPPVHIPPIQPIDPDAGMHVVSLPLCSYDTNELSSVQLWSDYDEDYYVPFLCKADVSGSYTGPCGSDANANAVCTGSTRGRPSASHYIITENLTGLDGAYGQSYEFANGSALYGTYYAECRRNDASQCNDTVAKVQALGVYIPGNYPGFTPTKVKLFDLDGGNMPYAGKVKASVNLAWYGTCSTCGQGVGPHDSDVVVAVQQQNADLTWTDLGTKTFTSSLTSAVMELEVGVEAGKRVRFQLRGENAGDQPHFAYAFSAARLVMPPPLVGRENHMRTCEYQPDDLAFNHFFSDPGAPFVCRGNINWNGCALDPLGHPIDGAYRLRAVNANGSTLPPIEMAWNDGSALHGVEEVICHHVSWIAHDETYDSFVKPLGGTCSVTNGISWTNLVEVDGGFIEHTRPVTVIGSARIWGPQWSKVTIAVQVLTPDATGMVSWQDASASTIVLNGQSPLEPFLVQATVAPYSDVRLQVRGECNREYHVVAANIFSECDPTDPFSCNP